MFYSLVLKTHLEILLFFKLSVYDVIFLQRLLIGVCVYLYLEQDSQTTRDFYLIIEV